MATVKGELLGGQNCILSIVCQSVELHMLFSSISRSSALPVGVGIDVPRVFGLERRQFAIVVFDPRADILWND